MASATLYDDPCKAGRSVVAYPSLLDPEATGRNFDDVGERALLTYATLRVEGCTVTSDRDLAPAGGRQGLALSRASRLPRGRCRSPSRSPG